MVTKFILALVAVLFISCTDDKEIDAGETEQIDASIIEIIPDAGVPETTEEERMAEEISWTWKTIFDDLGVSKGDKRRAKFDTYAKMLARNTKLFQDLNTDLGLIDYRLPYNKYNHILLAVLIYEESSVNPKVKGRSHGEVGFMQLHGAALQGYRKAEVQKDPELGLFLGIRWLARAITICGFDYAIIDSWDLNDFKGPLAVYNGGDHRAMTNGKCERNWGYARRKVSKTKRLITRLAQAN